MANPLSLKAPPLLSYLHFSISLKDHHSSSQGTYRKTLWTVCFFFQFASCKKTNNHDCLQLVKREYWWNWEILNVAFGQNKRKLWGRRKIPKIEGTSRIIKRYTFVMHRKYVMMPYAWQQVNICCYVLRRKGNGFHYNDRLFKFRKVIYLICYNSYIDVPLLDFTAACSRKDFREIDLIEHLSVIRCY